MDAKRHYLKEWREFRDLTQAQVAGRLAMLDDDKLPRTEASLSRIETGKQIYTERLLLALADIYRCEPAELVGHNPYKSGTLIDLVQRLSPHQQAQAQAVIEGLVLAEQRTPWTDPPDPVAPLSPRRKAG